MGKIIFFGTLAVLFLVACFIGVIALYLALKNWAWENMDIELPPKSKPKESYWNFFEDNSIITSHAFVIIKVTKSIGIALVAENLWKIMKNKEV